MRYEYLISVSLLIFPWAALFLLRGDLRIKMIWSSLAAMLTMGFEFLFIPNYWNPITLFNLAPFEIEGFIFMFFVGGICSACYATIFNKKEVKEKRRHPLHYLILLVIPLSYLITEFLFDFNIAYHFTIAMFVGAIGIWLIRRDLYKESIAGGAIFMILYFLLFKIVLVFFANISRFWNLEDLSRIFVLGVPIEELMLAFAFGMLWAPLYDDIENYRLISRRQNKRTAGIES